MAFANRLSERMEELRFPSVRSPNDETPYNTFASPPRADSSFFSTFQQPSVDSRGSLQRRFTTDSGKGSTAFGQGYNPGNTTVRQKTFLARGAAHALAHYLVIVGSINSARK